MMAIVRDTMRLVLTQTKGSPQQNILESSHLHLKKVASVKWTLKA